MGITRWSRLQRSLLLSLAFCISAPAGSGAVPATGSEVLQPIHLGQGPDPILVWTPDPGEAPASQQYGGYYRPVQPVPYQRKCGTVATDVCPTDVAVPAGATGEQLYQMATEADRAGRRNDAEGYLIKSAQMGYVRAEAAIGIQYAEGRGMPRDPAKALQYLAAAAKQGSAGAESKLGDMYRDGDGVSQDYATAARYYQQAAAQHMGSAEDQLGLLYEFGQGVPHNRPMAIQLMRRASFTASTRLPDTCILSCTAAAALCRASPR